MDSDLELSDENDQDSNLDDGSSSASSLLASSRAPSTPSTTSSLFSPCSPFVPNSSFSNTTLNHKHVPQLNDDVLAVMIDYLSMLDRIRFRLVNKQWKRVIDQFWEPQLSVMYFAKGSWMRNDNYNRYQSNSQSIEMASLNGIYRLLRMARFERLTKLCIHTNERQDVAIQQQLAIDLTPFWNLHVLEISGEMVVISPLDRTLPSLVQLSYRPMTEVLFVAFPNLQKLECCHFQCDRYSNPNLISLRLFISNPRITSRPCSWAPNLQHLHTSYHFWRTIAENLLHLRTLTVDLVHVQEVNPRIVEFQEEIESNRIQLRFNVVMPYGGAEAMLKLVSCLEKIGIPFVLFNERKVDLKQLSAHLTNDNIHMLKMTRLNLNFVRDDLDRSVLPFMFHTRSLIVVLNESNQNLFHECLERMPNISDLFIDGDFNASIVDRIAFHQPKLERLRLKSNTIIDFDLNFLIDLPHLTFLHLANMRLHNANRLVYVATHFRLFTNLRIELYAMDACPIQIADAMASRASKNPERFYEFNFYQVDNCEAFIQSFKQRFKEAPQNFHSDLFHV